MKKITLTLYSVGILILAISIIVVATVGANNATIKWVGLSFVFVGFGLLLAAFIIDFRKTMIVDGSQGDMFTTMSKEKLISLLDRFEIEYEEGKYREYYLYLVRENLKEDFSK